MTNQLVQELSDLGLLWLQKILKGVSVRYMGLIAHWERLHLRFQGAPKTNLHVFKCLLKSNNDNLKKKLAFLYCVMCTLFQILLFYLK